MAVHPDKLVEILLKLNGPVIFAETAFPSTRTFKAGLGKLAGSARYVTGRCGGGMGPAAFKEGRAWRLRTCSPNALVFCSGNNLA